MNSIRVLASIRYIVIPALSQCAVKHRRQHQVNNPAFYLFRDISRYVITYLMGSDLVSIFRGLCGLCVWCELFVYLSKCLCVSVS